MPSPKDAVRGSAVDPAPEVPLGWDNMRQLEKHAKQTSHNRATLTMPIHMRVIAATSQIIYTEIIRTGPLLQTINNHLEALEQSFPFI